MQLADELDRFTKINEKLVGENEVKRREALCVRMRLACRAASQTGWFMLVIHTLFAWVPILRAAAAYLLPCVYIIGLFKAFSVYRMAVAKS